MVNNGQANPLKPHIDKAASQVISGYFQGRHVLRRQQWINDRNVYRNDCVYRYSKGNVNHLDLIEYIAVSGPGHVNDGWSFLGRAIDALMKNDLYSAIHFAYYAELRAGMGLLAAEGIGVLNTDHPIVETSTSTSNVNLSNSGTHVYTWKALECWANSQRAMQVFDEVMKIERVGLLEWVNGISRAVNPRSYSQVSQASLMKIWIDIWSLDLRGKTVDRNLRNEVSYRPRIVNNSIQQPIVEEKIEFVLDLWRCFNPSSPGSFPAFDNFLLKNEIKRTVFKKSKSNDFGISQYKNHLCGSLNLSFTEFNKYAEFFSSNGIPEFFRYANMGYPNNKNILSQSCYYQIISRAILLLKLSTSVVRQQLLMTGVSVTDLNFWWQARCEGLGLSADIQSISGPLDLYSDILESLQGFQEWLDSHNSHSQYYLMKNYSYELNIIGAFELVGIWGLLP